MSQAYLCLRNDNARRRMHKGTFNISLIDVYLSKNFVSSEIIEKFEITLEINFLSSALLDCGGRGSKAELYFAKNL